VLCRRIQRCLHLDEKWTEDLVNLHCNTACYTNIIYTRHKQGAEPQVPTMKVYPHHSIHQKKKKTTTTKSQTPPKLTKKKKQITALLILLPALALARPTEQIQNSGNSHLHRRFTCPANVQGFCSASNIHSTCNNGRFYSDAEDTCSGCRCE
jgi:hypothetical protein